MKSFITWFYYQNLWSATAFILASTVLFIFLNRRFRHNWQMRSQVWLLMAAWIAAVLYRTLWSRMPGAPLAARMMPFQSYLDLLRGIWADQWRSNYMNLLLFYPAGVLLASCRYHWKHPSIFCAGCCTILCLFSISIEAVQYFFRLGLAETDDVIHNTLGAVTGMVTYCFLYHRAPAALLTFQNQLWHWLSE